MYGRNDLFIWICSLIGGLVLLSGCIAGIWRQEGMQTPRDRQITLVSLTAGIILALGMIAFAVVHRDIPAYYWNVGLF